MSNEIAMLKKKITELEDELKLKNAELLRYRQEIVKVNKSLDRVMGQLSHELQSAQALQKILTPTELPNISGFEWSTKFIPGNRFGGDYFDIFEHEDKLKFGVFISSASGYSMSSLLMSVMIKLSSQIEARRGMPADKVIQSILDEVKDKLSSKDSASIFYAVVDRRTFEMQYCCIGDILGFIQHTGKDALIEFNSCGNAFNKDTKINLKAHELSLNAKDRLVITSPGLTHFPNNEEKSWGSDGLIAAIRKAPRHGVHELRNEILFQWEQFSHKKAPVKDQTVIVIEVKDKVLKLAKS